MDMALLTKGPSNMHLLQPDHHHHHDHNLQMISTNSQVEMQSTSYTSTSLSPDSGGAQACPAGKWASKILRECARAVSDKDTAKLHHLLWMVNEMASPYGDCDQKLGSYFLQALFCKATGSGHRCFKTLIHVAEKSQTFDSARKLMLKFQELSPWTSFGHVASNGAILEALEGETKLHIIDISNTLCTQWPTFLEALATRSDETPSLKLTVVVTRASLVKRVMKEVAQRMEKFARLMGVPFEISIVSEIDHLGELTKEVLGVREDEAVAVNCMGALRRVRVEGRGGVIGFLKSLNPKIVTVVEEEADFTSSRNGFVKCFEECLRFYTLYFEMLHESFPPTSNERLVLERECSKTIVRVLACDDNNDDDDQGQENVGFEECERREKGKQWCEKLNGAFSPFGFSNDVLDDVKALLKRYRGGWGLVVPPQDHHETGAYLSWKDEPVVWAAAWKP